MGYGPACDLRPHYTPRIAPLNPGLGRQHLARRVPGSPDGELGEGVPSRCFLSTGVHGDLRPNPTSSHSLAVVVSVSISVAGDFSAIYTLSDDLGKASLSAAKKAHAVVAKSTFDLQHLAQRIAPRDTGQLANSITSTVITLRGEVGPTVHYAPHVEYGTVHMDPQPYMEPATNIIEPVFVTAMAKITEEIL